MPWPEDDKSGSVDISLEEKDQDDRTNILKQKEDGSPGNVGKHKELSDEGDDSDESPPPPLGGRIRAGFVAHAATGEGARAKGNTDKKKLKKTKKLPKNTESTEPTTPPTQTTQDNQSTESENNPDAA